MTASANTRARSSDEERERAVDLFDPFQAHFVSENKRNGFVKALEDNREYTFEPADYLSRDL